MKPGQCLPLGLASDTGDRTGQVGVMWYPEIFPAESVELYAYFSAHTPQVRHLEHRDMIFLAQATQLAEEDAGRQAANLSPCF